ncbi:MAG: hypothetical protein QM621_04095 [Aeromicrobium sp.]|uniref:protein kinase domain-containing protein n=1 Tax=Aeromicrobium sp. TaxID=1871063 RepID=UPI0039E3E109
MTGSTVRFLGQSFRLGESKGGGNSGWVYAVEGSSDFVVKVYIDEAPGGLVERVAFFHDFYRRWEKELPPGGYPIELIASDSKIEAVAMIRFNGNGEIKTLEEFFSEGLIGGVDAWTRLKIARLIVDQLSFFHANGIYVGDLKPQNIMVRIDGAAVEVGFVDMDSFGIVGRAPSEGWTEGFAAPEIADNSSLASPASDCVSLGIVILKVLMGSFTPFDGVVEGSRLHFSQERISAGESWINQDGHAYFGAQKVRPLNEWDEGLRRLVRRFLASVPAGTGSRPTADEWKRVLTLTAVDSMLGVPKPLCYQHNYRVALFTCHLCARKLCATCSDTAITSRPLCSDCRMSAQERSTISAEEPVVSGTPKPVRQSLAMSEDRPSGKCYKHPSLTTSISCDSCNRRVCRSCRKYVDRKFLCYECHKAGKSTLKRFSISLGDFLDDYLGIILTIVSAVFFGWVFGSRFLGDGQMPEVSSGDCIDAYPFDTWVSDGGGGSWNRVPCGDDEARVKVLSTDVNEDFDATNWTYGDEYVLGTVPREGLCFPGDEEDELTDSNLVWFHAMGPCGRDFTEKGIIDGIAEYKNIDSSEVSIDLYVIRSVGKDQECDFSAGERKWEMNFSEGVTTTVCAAPYEE